MFSDFVGETIFYTYSLSTVLLLGLHVQVFSGAVVVTILLVIH